MTPTVATPPGGRSKRMFFRVLGVFSAALLGMSVLYAALIIPLQKDSLLKILYSQATTVSRSIIQACSDAMLTDDFGFVVEHNLQVLQNNKGIQSVTVYPKVGSAIRIEPDGWRMDDDAPEALPPNRFEQETHALVNRPGQPAYYRFSVPVRFSGAVWGALEIHFSTAEYDANIASMYRQLLLISVLVTLVMMPVGYYLARWMMAPITTISRAANRVAQGDLTAQVTIDRQDEYGELSHSFNQMVEALQNSRERLQESNQTLERKVQERTRELDELNRTLDQRVHEEMAKRKEQETLLIHQSRLAAMGEMIGAIAHQWRQPLNALSLVMQNIRMQHAMGALSDESMARMQAKAATLVERMSSTIDEFRNFFKPGKHAEPFKVADAVRASVDMLDGVFRNHNITVTLVCDESLTLQGVQGEFAQVVLNLLGNAKDALLATRQPQPRIDLMAQRVGNRVELVVEDNGGGILDEAIDKIYEPYFTTKEEGLGTGIGLYMSKMIVENHMKGRLRASNTAEGARFTLDFPAI